MGQLFQQFFILFLASHWLCHMALAKPEEVIPVSMVSLIAHPQKYHGKWVRVGGYARLEFEGDSLYLSKSDKDFRNYKNGLWLDIDYDSYPQKKYTGKFVIVTGKFNKDFLGHRDLWSGSLKKITRIILQKP